MLGTLGVQIADSRRPMLRDCLDWTVRRDHLAGRVPAALLSHGMGVGWLARTGNRAVKVLPAAEKPFAELGVDLVSLRSP